MRTWLRMVWPKRGSTLMVQALNLCPQAGKTLLMSAAFKAWQGAGVAVERQSLDATANIDGACCAVRLYWRPGMQRSP